LQYRLANIDVFEFRRRKRRVSISFWTDDTIRKQFTGYERDSETDLDFAQARYFNVMHGRFATVDPHNIIFEKNAAKDPKDGEKLLVEYTSQPQNWGRYLYATNNPLKYVDPTGETITLTGTAEEQQAALARIKSILGDARYSWVRQETINGNIVLSLDNESVPKMQAIGSDADNIEFSVGMAEILNSSDTVEFRVTEKFTNVNGKEIDLGTPPFAGGLTVSGRDSSSGNIQIFVHPQAGAIMT